MKIKTFRGMLKDPEQQRIKLSTNNGLTGYKIRKLQLFSIQPGVLDEEHIVQVFTVPHNDTSFYDNVDFNDPTLLAAAYYKDDDQNYNPGFINVIIDSSKFNQDIYITHADVASSNKVNYYLELEQVKLDINEATVATLKDMRGRE